MAGGAALLAGPWVTGLDPTSHVYPATVWLLVIWTAVHVAVGVIMQLYCVARRLAGRMTARHDIDIAKRGALLALRRHHGRRHRRGDRRISAGRVRRRHDPTD